MGPSNGRHWPIHLSPCSDVHCTREGGRRVRGCPGAAFVPVGAPASHPTLVPRSCLWVPPSMGARSFRKAVLAKPVPSDTWPLPLNSASRNHGGGRFPRASQGLHGCRCSGERFTGEGRLAAVPVHLAMALPSSLYAGSAFCGPLPGPAHVFPEGHGPGSLEMPVSHTRISGHWHSRWCESMMIFHSFLYLPNSLCPLKFSSTICARPLQGRKGVLCCPWDSPS